MSGRILPFFIDLGYCHHYDAALLCICDFIIVLYVLLVAGVA